MASTTMTIEGFLSSLATSLEDACGEQKPELRQLPLQLTKLVENGNVETAEKAIQLLGTAAGKHEEWRSIYRETGILSHAIQKLEISTTPLVLVKQYLRVIGNCVADNDTNRELVTKDLARLVPCLEHKQLISTALAVLLNLCNGYEPAQVQAAAVRFDSTISCYLANDRIPEEAVDYAVDLITWTTEKLTSAQIQDAVTLETFENLLKFALPYDEYHYHDCVAILAYHLQEPEFQQKITTSEILERLADLTLDYEARLGPQELRSVFQALATQVDPEKAPSEEVNVRLLVQLINSLSAISASDAFVKNHNITSPVVETMRQKLQSIPIPPSSVCACVMLGNLATSDEVSTDMVKTVSLHQTLIDILSKHQEPALLYSAAACMRHLAFPEANKTILGEAGVIELCCHLLVNEDPSIRGEAAAILGKLVLNNMQNIQKVVYEAIPDSIMHATLSDVQIPATATILYHIVTQALVPSPPVPSISMKIATIELGRTIVAVLGSLSRTFVGEDAESIAGEVLKIPSVARPIAWLVRQRFFAEARSQGLFGLGLMARSPEGAACVIAEMKAYNDLLDAIKELAVPQENEGQQGASKLGPEYSNALVLLQGLITNGAGSMDLTLRDNVDALHAELSKFLV